MAPGLTETIKQKVTSMTENAKIADLQRDMHKSVNQQIISLAMVNMQLIMNSYEDPSNRITTDYGVKQSNTDDWLRVASEDKTGPALLEDHASREKIHRFDHERIPERVVHARGAAAHGTFKLFESAADVSSAGVLTDTSRTTPVFLRFSTVLGSRGSADTVRDVRGFAIKFYTEEGNWDIVGYFSPVSEPYRMRIG